MERAFGVLKAKWHIVKNAARVNDLGRLRYIMYARIIMHNMVVKDERDDSIYDQGFEYQGEKCYAWAPRTDNV